jgi:hypothetical protein
MDMTDQPTIRQRVDRLTSQVLDHIEETGVVVNGQANADIEYLAMLVNTGTQLRAMGLARYLSKGKESA